MKFFMKSDLRYVAPRNFPVFEGRYNTVTDYALLTYIKSWVRGCRNDLDGASSSCQTKSKC